MGHGVTISEIFQYGPNFLSLIGKKMKNQFWKQILCSVSPFMQGAVYCYSENIATATMFDFYRPGTSVLYTRAELETSY